MKLSKKGSVQNKMKRNLNDFRRQIFKIAFIFHDYIKNVVSFFHNRIALSSSE